MRFKVAFHCEWDDGFVEDGGNGPESNPAYNASRGYECPMTKSRNQYLSEKADEERRKCRDWLLKFMRGKVLEDWEANQ